MRSDINLKIENGWIVIRKVMKNDFIISFGLLSIRILFEQITSCEKFAWKI